MEQVPDYGLGLAPVVDVLVDVSVSVVEDGVEALDVEVSLELELLLEPPPAGDGFTMVVLLSAFAAGDAPAAGATVSVFCSQAASNAALARTQMYFFIFGWVARCGSQVIRRK